MKNMNKKLFFIAVTILLSGIYILMPYQSEYLNSSSYSDINTYIISKMAELRIPGASLGIVKGEEIYVTGYGSADSSGRPVTAETPFLLGSTTKSLTSVAIMQLAEQGSISLDEKVITYLPEFQFKNRKESNQITVRQLLNQTSGIIGSTGGSDFLDDDSSRKDFIEKLSKDKLSDSPGDNFVYAEANYIILGEIISAVSGQSYESYIEEHLFKPLDMEHSYTNKTAASKDGLASGHITWFGYPIETDLPYPMQYSSASALYSSAEDLTHYISLYLNKGTYHGQSILSPNSIEEIIKPSVSLYHPVGYSYGMGWFVNNDLVMHNGSPTNYYSILLIEPESKVGVVFLVNANNRLITGEYIMQLTYDIMNKLTDTSSIAGGIGYRQLYKIINTMFFWLILILTFRIIITFSTWPKKVKSKELTAKAYFKSLLTDTIFLVVTISLFIYLLVSYGVSARIAYLGQPDIVLCLCIIIALLAINIIAKICLFIKKSPLPFMS